MLWTVAFNQRVQERLLFAGLLFAFRTTAKSSLQRSAVSDLLEQISRRSFMIVVVLCNLGAASQSACSRQGRLPSNAIIGQLFPLVYGVNTL